MLLHIITKRTGSSILSYSSLGFLVDQKLRGIIGKSDMWIFDTENKMTKKAIKNTIVVQAWLYNTLHHKILSNLYF